MDVQWDRTSTSVSWERGGDMVRLTLEDAPRSVAYINDADVIVVVEAIKIPSIGSNAVVYNSDGTERLRLQPPLVSDPIGFDQVFQSRAGVTAVFATRKGDVHGRPNFATGLLEDVREWR